VNNRRRSDPTNPLNNMSAPLTVRTVSPISVQVSSQPAADAVATGAVGTGAAAAAAAAAGAAAAAAGAAAPPPTKAAAASAGSLVVGLASLAGLSVTAAAILLLVVFVRRPADALAGAAVRTFHVAVVSWGGGSLLAELQENAASAAARRSAQLTPSASSLKTLPRPPAAPPAGRGCVELHAVRLRQLQRPVRG